MEENNFREVNLSMADHHVKPAMHGGLDNEMGAND